MEFNIMRKKWNFMEQNNNFLMIKFKLNIMRTINYNENAVSFNDKIILNATKIK